MLWASLSSDVSMKTLTSLMPIALGKRGISMMVANKDHPLVKREQWDLEV